MLGVCVRAEKVLVTGLPSPGRGCLATATLEPTLLLIS